MLKNTHIELSTSLVLWFIFLTFTWILTLLWWTFPIYVFLLLPILAVLPDSDHPESYLNKKFPLLKNIHALWPHRTWTHDVFTLFVVSVCLYLWFWWLFWYYDYLPQLDWKEWISKYLEYVYFLIKSPNYIAIYIALVWHTFWDFLTKWSIKFFWWCERISQSFWKIKLLKYTILLPFTLLYTIQELLNKIKWNIFPLTWSWFEKNIYATIFNIINYCLLFVLFFVIWIHEKILYTLSLIAWEWKTLSLLHIWIFAIFFWISMWYFFSLSFEKLKQYLKTWTWIIKFIVFEIIMMFVLYLIYTKLWWHYWWYILVVSIVWTVILYRKFIKLDFEYFNIVLNECLLIIIYLYLSILILWSSIFVPQYNKDHVNKTYSVDSLVNTIQKSTDTIKDNISQEKEQKEQKTTKKEKNKQEHKQEHKQETKKENNEYKENRQIQKKKDSIFW